MNAREFLLRWAEVMDEPAWSRDVWRTRTDADIIGRWVSYEPKAQNAWPFVSQSSLHPMERVARALEAAKPSNVKLLRESRT